MSEPPGRDNPPRPTSLESLARGLRARTLPTAKMATRLSLAMAKRTFLGASDGADTDDRTKAIEAATSLVAEMGQLKGLAIESKTEPAF